MSLAEAYIWGIAAGVLPVFAFLAALALLDTFKLVRTPLLTAAIALGATAALLAWLLNHDIFATFGPAVDWYGRFGAPWLEELLKALCIAWLLRTERVVFMVDAAICGFAIGAGFALVENLSYLETLAGAGPALWLLRGFGTAIMHGGATAIVGVVGIALRRHGRVPALIVGFILALVIHTLWDSGILTPLQASLTIVIGLPPLFILIFARSEQALRNWLGQKLDRDFELLEMISTGNFLETPAGRYLRSLHNFSPNVLGDMVCILQITAEISAAAKGNLIRLGAGLPPEPDPELPRHLRELDHLNRSIGIAGRHALAPLLSLSARDRWELRNLADQNYGQPQ